MNALQVRSNPFEEEAAEDNEEGLAALLAQGLDEDDVDDHIPFIPFEEKALSCDVNRMQSMFFTANGLSNYHLKNEFAELVRAAFPNRVRKDGRLQVKTLALWDSCFLKEAVWNKAWKCTYQKPIDFDSAENYNYSSLAAKTEAALFEAVEPRILRPF